MLRAAGAGSDPGVTRARLREAGLWALDPASYFSCCSPLGGAVDEPAPPEAGSSAMARLHIGRCGFLAYDNGVAAAVAAAAAAHQRQKGRPMAALHRHFVAAAYQLAAFQDAWALARCAANITVGQPSCRASCKPALSCNCNALAHAQRHYGIHPVSYMSNCRTA